MSDIIEFIANPSDHAAAPPPGERLLQQVLAQVTAQNVTSGIVHRTSPRHSQLLQADGSSGAPALNQQQWQDALAERDAGRMDGSTALLPQVRELAAAHHERGHVPVFIAGFDYSTVRSRVWTVIERSEQSGEAAALPFDSAGEMLEPRQAFLASAVLPREFAAFVALPHEHCGQDVVFVFPSQGLLGDAAAGTSLRVDFGEGAGLRPVAFDTPVELRYANLGEQQLRLELDGPQGLRQASFRITLVEEPALSQCIPLVREERPAVTATIRRPGIRVVRAQALVFRDRNKPRITRPLLMVEGFPGNYPWHVSTRYANQENFLCRLVNQGYDVILVKFPDGPQRLEANAYALIAQILDIIAAREGNEPLIVGGFSMGGVIARYALAYMEHERRADPNKPHHQTRKLFTIDSPHEGANLAASVQAVAQGVRGDGDEAILMRTEAAQQLLLTWIAPPPWTGRQRFGASRLRQEFLRELERVGSMPKELEDTIAIANGSGTGQRQSPPGALATKYACTLWFYGDYFTQPLNQSGATVAQFRNGGDTCRFVSHGGYGVDSAPGGVWENPLFRRAHDAAPSWVHRELPIENSCFIPTTSALAISGSNYFRQPDLGQSKFRSVTYSHEGNLPHVKLTPTLVDFLVRFITRPASECAPVIEETAALS